MNTDLLIPLIGSICGLLGTGGLLHFWNTRKGTKDKTDNEAYTVYSQWVAGAMGQAAAENSRLNGVISAERGIKSLLIALVLDLIDFARRKGATYDEVEPFQARLDEARRM